MKGFEIHRQAKSVLDGIDDLEEAKRLTRGMSALPAWKEDWRVINDGTKGKQGQVYELFNKFDGVWTGYSIHGPHVTASEKKS